jgi:hypothetical protein
LIISIYKERFVLRVFFDKKYNKTTKNPRKTLKPMVKPQKPKTKTQAGQKLRFLTTTAGARRGALDLLNLT